MKKIAKNTETAQSQQYVLFAYLIKKNIDQAFEDLSSKELDEMLVNFFPEVRTNNGELYRKSSLISVGHGLQESLFYHSDVRDIIPQNDFKCFQHVVKYWKGNWTQV